MEENEGTQICPNCNRDIPKRNFVIHSVHCARNIKICPVCKEPFPQDELQAHFEKMHLLVPCKQCGEKVRGTDMEDHIRDSCALTMQSCRYCSLELVRREVPAHERYCGARTELCSDCGEYVMLRYRQLHLDSNHGFLRLHDDPQPRPSITQPVGIIPYRPQPIGTRPNPQSPIGTMPNLQPPIGTRPNPQPPIGTRPNPQPPIGTMPSLQPPIGAMQNRPPRPALNERRPILKICNFYPTFVTEEDNQRITADVRAMRDGQPEPSREEITRGLDPLRGRTETQYTYISPEERVARRAAAGAMQVPAVGQGDAGQPGGEYWRLAIVPRPRNNQRTVTLKRTNDQPQINTTVTPQDKLQNKPGTRGIVKKRLAPKPPEVASAGEAATSSTPASASASSPAPDPRRDLPYYSALQRRQEEDRHRREQTAYNLSVGLPPVLDPAAKLEKLRKMDALHNRETESVDYKHKLTGRVWQPSNSDVPANRTLGRGASNGESPPAARLADLQPMSPEQFMERFNELRLLKEPPAAPRARLGDIRSSLRELRRGLNEVTAPYNNTASVNNNNSSTHNSNIDSSVVTDMLSGPNIEHTDQLEEARALPTAQRSPEVDVLVPCEFCSRPMRAAALREHERVCSMSLSSATTSRAASPSHSLSPCNDEEIPVIPCEFCTESLPLYLICEHQELCGRGTRLLYPD